MSILTTFVVSTLMLTGGVLAMRALFRHPEPEPVAVHRDAEEGDYAAELIAMGHPEPRRALTDEVSELDLVRADIYEELAKKYPVRLDWAPDWYVHFTAEYSAVRTAVAVGT